jgi:hypothetical protein
MSTPYVPPYFGSYEEIVNALLHDPFLGSGRSHYLPQTHVQADELNPQPLPPRAPTPDPWRNAAVRYLATLVQMQELARTVGNPETSRQLIAQSQMAIQAFLDDYCGTPPRRIPWPWPGPPPWVLTLAAELTSAANTQIGSFREGLMQVAGQVAELGLPAAKTMGTGV